MGFSYWAGEREMHKNILTFFFFTWYCYSKNFYTNKKHFWEILRIKWLQEDSTQTHLVEKAVEINLHGSSRPLMAPLLYRPNYSLSPLKLINEVQQLCGLLLLCFFTLCVFIMNGSFKTNNALQWTLLYRATYSIFFLFNKIHSPVE